jgi:hypothetical protein
MVSCAISIFYSVPFGAQLLNVNGWQIVTGLGTRFCDIWSPKHMTIDMTVILHAFK